MKYKRGDRVRIRVGHPYWQSGVNTATGKDDLKVVDIEPDLAGRGATVTSGHVTQGIEFYSLEIDKDGHRAWFQLKQLVPEREWLDAIKTRYRRFAPVPPGLRKYLYPLTSRQCHKR